MSWAPGPQILTERGIFFLLGNDSELEAAQMEAGHGLWDWCIIYH